MSRKVGEEDINQNQKRIKWGKAVPFMRVIMLLEQLMIVESVSEKNIRLYVWKAFLNI